MSQPQKECKNRRNGFLRNSAPFFTAFHGGTVDWNEPQETLVPQAVHVERPAPQGRFLASFGVPFRFRIFPRGESWNDPRENALERQTPWRPKDADGCGRFFFIRLLGILRIAPMRARTRAVSG
jgi:hypothetical protein